MSYVLRDYQVEAVEAAIQSFTGNQPFIIQAATAAGKSLVISELCHRLDKPVLILQPSKEILEQNYAKLANYGITDIACYSASVGQKEIGKFTFATIGSIYRKPELFRHFEYAILDECHLLSAKKVNSMLMKFFRDTGIRKVCGLTATPFRLENKFFGDRYTGCVKMLNRITKNSFFREIAYKVELPDLIEQGYLTAPTYHTFETDLSDLIVNTTGRDYTEESLEKWSNRRLSQFLKVAEQLDQKHQRVLVFCTSIRQAEAASAALKMLGIDAPVLTAKTPKKTRESMVSAFQNGKKKWMLNVATMTTGFDCPPLDAVVLLRPTMSVPLYIQILGRCLRLDPDNPDKEAHFYDFTGTVEKFGKAETIRLAKEDGFRDMLVSEVGRLDNKELFSFEVKRDPFKKTAPPKPQPDERPKEITLDYLLSRV